MSEPETNGLAEYLFEYMNAGDGRWSDESDWSMEACRKLAAGALIEQVIGTAAGSIDREVFHDWWMVGCPGDGAAFNALVISAQVAFRSLSPNKPVWDGGES